MKFATTTAATVVVAIVALLIAGAPRAAAHGNGSTATTSNFATVVTDPGIDGLRWRVLGGDEQLELTNNTGSDITVIGYRGEPYLRFNAEGGVDENTRSPTTYLNRDRYGDAQLPPDATADAQPDWEPVTDTNRYAWADHRAHWMSTDLPPQARDEPTREHLITTWAIPVQVDDGDQQIDTTVTGELKWLPDADWKVPILATAAVPTAAVAITALFTRARDRRWPALARVTIVVILTVLSADIMRTIDDLATPGTPVGERLVIAIATIVAFTLVISQSARAWYGRPRGFASLAAAAVLIMLIFASRTTHDLTAPQLHGTFPDWTRRWSIAASYTIVAPAFLAAAIAARWYANTTRTTPRPEPAR